MSDSNNQCPICLEGEVHPQVGKNVVEYRGRTAELDLHFSLCVVCGSEQANPDQTRANKRLMNAFKKQVDGLLTGAEVRKLREGLGLSQAEAAQIFGGGPVAFSKYEADDVAQSEAMDKLLRLAVALPAAFELLWRPFFGGGPVAFSKYEADDVAQSEAMDKLLRLAVAPPAAFELPRRRSGVDNVIAGKQWQAVKQWQAAQSPQPPARDAGSVRIRLISSSRPNGEKEAQYAA